MTDLLVNLVFVIQTRMSLAGIKASGKRDGELSYQTVVSYTKVPKLARESYKVSNAVGVSAYIFFSICHESYKSGACILPSINTARYI